MFKTFPKDLLASFVVFLVALPLSLGIALASGAPIVSGLIAAAVGGIVAGALGGVALQVSGPAVGLTVIVAGVVHTLGWASACLVTLIAGLMQIVLGLLGIGRATLGITPAVIHGMLGGVGITIALAQACVMFGGKPGANTLESVTALPAIVASGHVPSILLGGLAVTILIMWGKLPPALQLIPGPLVAVLVPSAIAVYGDYEMARVALPDPLTKGLTFPSIPSVSQWAGVLAAAATVAIVASVESLLSAVATEKMHARERAHFDRELVGQGAANLVSGALGGLPITGVILRSSANVRSGARTRLSAILHGVWIIVFAALCGPYLERIPVAVLAGLPVYMGLRLVDKDQIRDLARHRELATYVVTAFGVTFFGLLTGVVVGVAFSFAILLYRVGNVRIDVRTRRGRTRILVDGTLTTLTVPRLTLALNGIPAGSTVRIDLYIDFMDHAVYETLHLWEQEHVRTGGTVEIVEHRELWYALRQSDRPRLRKGAVSGPSVVEKAYAKSSIL